MQEFSYKVKDPQGVHARPAGLLIKLYKDFTSEIKISNGQKEVNGKHLIALMGLHIKQGDMVHFTVNGTSEVEDAIKIKNFVENNL